jgi:hypothetical protein
LKTENDQLAVLRRLQEEGSISSDEFDHLASGLHNHDKTVENANGTATEDEPPEEVEPETPEPAEGASSDLFRVPSLREDLNANFLGVLLLAAFAVIVVCSLGMLAWWVGIPTILLLMTTLFQGWSKVTFIGAAAVAAILVLSLALPSNGDPAPQAVATATLPPQDPYPPIPGSLGIYMDQVSELWNTVEGPPHISKGLTRYNETGEYDTFLYRFGQWGRLAGAYEPDSEAIYALLVTGRFDGDATDQMYLHLCFLIAPYSQECIDSYTDEGLDGGTLEDFADATHEAEWSLGDQTWRLQIDQNVLTLRVFGADAA